MDMAEMDAEGERLSTQEPRKFSELLRSSQENSKTRPTSESQIGSDEKEKLKELVQRKIMETQQALLKEIQLTVPRRFFERAQMKTLGVHLTPIGRKALEYCQRWAEAPSGMSGPLLMGKSGTFKTHLLWATARTIHDRVYNGIRTKSQHLIDEAYAQIDSGELRSPSAFRVQFSYYPTLDLVVTDGAQIAHDVRSSVERRNLDEVVAKYRQFGKEPQAAVLLVDDVEVMKLSDWLHEELYRIFDYRYQERMPTLVATNLSTEELRQHLGDRIARRIMDMTEPFKL